MEYSLMSLAELISDNEFQIYKTQDYKNHSFKVLLGFAYKQKLGRLFSYQESVDLLDYLYKNPSQSPSEPFLHALGNTSLTLCSSNKIFLDKPSVNKYIKTLSPIILKRLGPFSAKCDARLVFDALSPSMTEVQNIWLSSTADILIEAGSKISFHELTFDRTTEHNIETYMEFVLKFQNSITTLTLKDSFFEDITPLMCEVMKISTFVAFFKTDFTETELLKISQCISNMEHIALTSNIDLRKLGTLHKLKSVMFGASLDLPSLSPHIHKIERLAIYDHSPENIPQYDIFIEYGSVLRKNLKELIIFSRAPFDFELLEGYENLEKLKIEYLTSNISLPKSVKELHLSEYSLPAGIPIEILVTSP
jgi:hypothetical protein